MGRIDQDPVKIFLVSILAYNTLDYGTNNNCCECELNTVLYKNTYINKISQLFVLVYVLNCSALFYHTTHLSMRKERQATAGGMARVQQDG